MACAVAWMMSGFTVKPTLRKYPLWMAMNRSAASAIGSVPTVMCDFSGVALAAEADAGLCRGAIRRAAGTGEDPDDRNNGQRQEGA